MVFFFFFKQKTAYEMRISDWSSDVCSPDLLRGPAMLRLVTQAESLGLRSHACRSSPSSSTAGWANWICATSTWPSFWAARRRCRSEEHTSELQSLMRISYAVFCLKKKQNNADTKQHYTKTYTISIKNNTTTYIQNTIN